ncbi:hypothetical protein CLV88_12625, partial [Shimia abyssi]
MARYGGWFSCPPITLSKVKHGRVSNSQGKSAVVQLASAVSTGRRNTLIFLERWSVDHEVPDADVLYGQ